ncbi:hypothetical protein H0H87_001281 [Tephrocybe sp. NHM501043]|nr:hypothetical protein H0H87_001281 [Tephrocybe sp. NHM501043]
MDDDGEEAIEIDEAFTKNSRFPGTVKIIVESTTFWLAPAHKEVLFFASPFFEAALSGNWSETGPGRPPSMSSVITISQPPTVPSERAKANTEASTEMTFTPIDPEVDASELDIIAEQDTTSSSSTSEGGEAEVDWSESDIVTPLPDKPDEITRARENSLAKLQGAGDKGEGSSQLMRPSVERPHFRRTRLVHGPDAVIVLKEERRECLTFLLTHAAGKPIKALRIAELFEEEELYREASRFVLDNPGGWLDEEMATLSQETLLKLEKRHVTL